MKTNCFETILLQLLSLVSVTQQLVVCSSYASLQNKAASHVVISILIDIPGKQLFFKKISSIYFCKTNN
jgi:hypothetical protein